MGYSDLLSPRELALRWRALSLIEELSVAEGLPYPLIGFRDSGPHSASGYIAGASPYCGDAWIQIINKSTLFYGRDAGWASRLDHNTRHRARLDCAIRKSLTICPEFTSHLEVECEKMPGVDFAMCATSPLEPWRDLTGEESPARFHPAEIFYGTVQSVADYMLHEYSIPPSARASVISILQNIPLTPLLAKDLMPHYKWSRALDAAMVRGYPVEEGSTNS